MVVIHPGELLKAKEARINRIKRIGECADRNSYTERSQIEIQTGLHEPAGSAEATAVVGVVARRAPNSLQIYGTVLSLAYVSTFLVFPHSEASDSPRRWRGGAIPCTRDATTPHVPE